MQRIELKNKPLLVSLTLSLVTHFVLFLPTFNKSRVPQKKETALDILLSSKPVQPVSDSNVDKKSDNKKEFETEDLVASNKNPIEENIQSNKQETTKTSVNTESSATAVISRDLISTFTDSHVEDELKADKSLVDKI